MSVATANAPAPVSRPSQLCDSNDHHESRIDVAVSPPIRIETPSTSHQSTAWYGFEPASERNSLDCRNLPDPPTSGVMVSSVCCKLACPAVPNSQCKKQGYLRAFNIQYRLDAFPSPDCPRTASSIQYVEIDETDISVCTLARLISHMTMQHEFCFLAVL